MATWDPEKAPPADRAPGERVHGEEPTRRDLERALFELRREKAQLEGHVRKLEAQKNRLFGEPEDKKDGEEPPKEEKKSTYAARITLGEDDEELKPEEDDEEEKKKDEAKEEKKDEEKKEEEDKDGRRKRARDGRPAATDPRSRNLFGKLLGHLHAAKQKLEVEKSAKSAMMREEANKRLQEKLNVNNLNLKEFRKQHFEQQQKEEQAKILDLDKQIFEKELQLLQTRLERHYSLMMNFIRTKTEPTIFFLPAKHTKETESMLEETRAAIKHKIGSLKMQLTDGPTQEQHRVTLSLGEPDGKAEDDGNERALPDGQDESEAVDKVPPEDSKPAKDRAEDDEEPAEGGEEEEEPPSKKQRTDDD